MKRTVLCMLAVAALIGAWGCGAGGRGAAGSTVIMTVLGAKTPDFEEVLSLANGKIRQKTGSSLSVEFIPLSDYATKYPLLLAAGTGSDLVFTAPWCFFQEEVRKGAFKELTMEFIKRSMPLTYAAQAPASWKQIAVDGKIYAVPRNESDFDITYGAVIRGDLRVKYGLDPIEDFPDFEAYLLTVAEKERSGISAFHLFPSFPVAWVLLNAVNNWFSPDVAYAYVWDADGGGFSTEELRFSYGTPEYREYALRMARWARAGVWPSNAIAGTVHTNDLFREGRSAANLAMYKTADSLIRDCAAKGIRDVEYYNIFAPAVRTMRSPYSYDSCAILASCKQPERAAAVLDLIKNDRDVNLLLIGGIEGRHYVLGPDGTHSAGPEAADYPWDGWTWCIRNNWNPVPGGMNDMVKEVREEFRKAELEEGVWPCDGFVFDPSSVRAEQAVIDSILSEYRYSFDLGAYGDRTEAKLAEMLRKFTAAGLDAVTGEFKAQLAKYTGK